MTFTFKLAKRIAILRAPDLALIFCLSAAGCTGADELGPTADSRVLSIAPEDTVTPPPAPPIAPEDTILGPPPPPADTVLPPPSAPRDTVLPPPSAPTDTVLPPPSAMSFSGIPLGAYDVPASAMTSFSGAVVTTTPSNIVNITSAARMAGARVVLRLTSNAQLQNADGTFSLRKWKAAVDRYARVDLSLGDGTIAGHILVQNPHRADQWGGREIPYATLEEMARYSRMRWSGLPTIVKAPLSWLAATPTPWRYLDAASTVYAGAAGDVENWANRQARTAANAGLGLLVGMNVLDGPLTSGQLASWGSALLNQDHVCGLVMYRYNAAYFGRPDVRNAVAYLVEKARMRSRTSCRVRA